MGGAGERIVQGNHMMHKKATGRNFTSRVPSVSPDGRYTEGRPMASTVIRQPWQRGCKCAPGQRGAEAVGLGVAGGVGWAGRDGVERLPHHAAQHVTTRGPHLEFGSRRFLLQQLDDPALYNPVLTGYKDTAAKGRQLY